MEAGNPVIKEAGKPVIELPRSHLYVCDGALQKRTEDGHVTAWHKLTEIRKVKVVQLVDRTAFTVSIVLAAAGIAAKTYLSSVIWGWTALIALLLGSLLSLFGVKYSVLHVEMKSGQIQYPLSVSDSRENCNGFTLTLNTLIAEAKARQN